MTDSVARSFVNSSDEAKVKLKQTRASEVDFPIF